MKIITVFLLLFTIAFNIFPQYFNSYVTQKVYSLPEIIENKKIQLISEDGYSGPGGPNITLFSNGSIVLIDILNNRIIFLDKNNNVEKVSSALLTTNIGIQGEMFLNYKYFVIMYSDQSLIAYSNAGEMLYKVDIKKANDFLLMNKLVVCVDHDLYSFLNPGTDLSKNNKNILNEQATRQLLLEPEKNGLQGLVIDEKLRFFINGNLVTRNYETFYNYWSVKNNEKSLRYSNANFRWDATQYLNQQVVYIGRDEKGNSYWTPGYPIMVYNAKGYLIDFFIPNPDNLMNIKKTPYSIHPSGDVYFLDYDKNGVYLYCVENVWDKAGRAFWYETNATVTAPNVRLRKKPNLTGEEAGYLQTDERVVILETSAETTKVGDMNSPWYRVKTIGGVDAWAYSGFIEKDN
jgi:hypothetical protein